MSDTWTGFTRFTILDEKPQDGYTWSGAIDIQARLLVARDLERHVGLVETRREAKVGYRKTELDNARRLHGIYFIDPDDEEFKDIMKNARSKLEVPMPAATLCKTQREKYMETCRAEKKCKTEYACIVEADESMRIRMERSLHKDHKDRIAGKGMNTLNHYNLVHKFISTPQAMKIPEAKEKQWTKNGKHLK